MDPVFQRDDWKRRMNAFAFKAKAPLPAQIMLLSPDATAVALFD